MSKTQYKVEKTPQGVYLLYRRQVGQRKFWLQRELPTQEQIDRYEADIKLASLSDEEFVKILLNR